MRAPTVLALALLVLPAAATAIAPERVVLPWYNGDLDSAIAAPTFGPGFGLHNARIGDLDGDIDGEKELIINGHASGEARFSKSHVPGTGGVVTRTLLPATTALQFRVEARAGGDCFVWHDIRAILMGTLDPLPAVDTLYGIDPFLPVDYFNDEVLVFGAQYNGGKVLRPGQILLDPLEAKVLGGGFPGFGHPFNAMSPTEKAVWLQQHYLLVWVFYAAAYEGGASTPGTECAFDDFAYVLRPALP
jgi:hypothetical protein